MEKILNRGFLNGPLSIQYGIIMIIVLLDINDLWDYPLYQFITCMVIVFMTEYAVRCNFEENYRKTFLGLF